MSSYKLTYDQQHVASITPTSLPVPRQWNGVLVWLYQVLDCGWGHLGCHSHHSYLLLMLTHPTCQLTGKSLAPSWFVCILCGIFADVGSHALSRPANKWPLKYKRFSCVLWPASEAGKLTFLLINPLRWIKSETTWIDWCQWGRFVLKQFDCSGKEAASVLVLF